jgi:hypothetical protein
LISNSSASFDKLSPMARAKLDIPVGTRFKMSPLGAARSPGLAAKQGTIIGGSRYATSVRVRFDGYKTPTSLHRDYIELLPTELEDNGA